MRSQNSEKGEDVELSFYAFFKKMISQKFLWRQPVGSNSKAYSDYREQIKYQTTINQIMIRPSPVNG